MIHSLHYFPCIHSIADLLQEKELAFDGEYPFKRSSFRNRTIIAGSTGPITLSIPVVGGRNVKLPYKEVQIDYTNNWQRDHFRTLCTTYGNSPFFQFYRDELEHVYNTQPTYLYEWNFNCLKWVLKKMKVNPPDFDKNNPNAESEPIATLLEYLPTNYKNPLNRNLITYSQVFQDKIGFLVNLSVLDLLFNEGPGSLQILLNANAKLHSISKV